MTEIRIAIGEPKWPGEKSRAIGVEFAHKHPWIYKMIRKAVKERHFDYVSRLVEAAKEGKLPEYLRRIRFSEYITRLTYSEIKIFAPIMWKAVKDDIEEKEKGGLEWLS